MVTFLWTEIKGFVLERCPHCLDYSTIVPVIDDKGLLTVGDIGDFYEKLAMRFGEIASADAHFIGLVNEEFKTLSIDNFKLVPKKIIRITRHPIKERLIRIKARGGRFLDVTENHPVYVSAKPWRRLILNDFTLKKALDLHPSSRRDVYWRGDRIMVANQLPKPRKVFKFINILESQRKLASIRVHGNKFHLLGSPHWLPITFPISKELARFLGYFIAEGHPVNHEEHSTYRLSISNSDQSFLDDALNCAAKVFHSAYFNQVLIKHDRVPTVDVNSKFALWLITDFFGIPRGAYNKRLPYSCFNWQKDKQEQLLDAYIRGDGWNSHHSCTTSRVLANQIYCLLLQLNRTPSLWVRSPRETGFGVGRHQFVLNEYQGRPYKALNDVSYRAVQTTEIVDPTSDSLYDLTVELSSIGPNFLAGNGCVIKNCQPLYGYSAKGGPDLLDIFSKDSPMKNILKRQKFDLDHLERSLGKVTIERRQRGSDLRRDLNLRLSRPDPLVDIDIRRLAKLVNDYGVEPIRTGIFIDRFEIINLTVWKPLQYRYHIQYVPSFLSAFAPYGMMQAVSSKEPEEEIEKLLFPPGGSRIKPAVSVATALR